MTAWVSIGDTDTIHVASVKTMHYMKLIIKIHLDFQPDSHLLFHTPYCTVSCITKGLQDNFPEDVFQMREAHSERLARTDIVHRPFARTNYFYNSFVPSSIAAWNALEDVQVCTNSLSSFKRLLHSC